VRICLSPTLPKVPNEEVSQSLWGSEKEATNYISRYQYLIFNNQASYHVPLPNSKLLLQKPGAPSTTLIRTILSTWLLRSTLALVASNVVIVGLGCIHVAVKAGFRFRGARPYVPHGSRCYNLMGINASLIIWKLRCCCEYIGSYGPAIFFSVKNLAPTTMT
jgi:hypothetical protein